MNISLTPQLESLIHTKVDTGLYNSASEVVREALRLLEEQDRLKAFKLELLKQELASGITSLDNGKGLSISVSEIADKVLQSQNKSDL